jgi:precorrin-2 dehydrogenase/sirohydrochlorin ferrochelatase
LVLRIVAARSQVAACASGIRWGKSGEGMSYYPVSLDLKDRFCIVIGGGKVAERKVRGLLACEAAVQVISPRLTSGLADLFRAGLLTWQERDYRSGDLSGAFLVIAATDNEQVQQRTYEEAEERNILINVADVPGRCNFILPATVRQGDLTVSVSTGGKSPALAKRLRQELEKSIGPEYKIIADILGNLRGAILARGRPQAENEAMFNRLLHRDMPRWVQERDWDRVERHIRTVLGGDISIDWLEKEFYVKH